MPSRSARRNAHKRLARALQLAAAHSRLACRWLKHWRVEAERRARLLGAPAAWALLRERAVVKLLWRLDPSGELEADLKRTIAEVVARVSDPRMACGKRRLAVRAGRE